MSWITVSESGPVVPFSGPTRNDKMPVPRSSADKRCSLLQQNHCYLETLHILANRSPAVHLCTGKTASHGFGYLSGATVWKPEFKHRGFGVAAIERTILPATHTSGNPLP